MNKSINFIVIVFLIGCSGSGERPALNDVDTVQEEVPAHLKDVKNLKVLADLNPSEEITFTKFQTFGEIYPQLLSPQLGFGREMAVDTNGFVYRADKAERTIWVFDNDGELVKKLGRDGRGPGEFQSIVALDVFQDQLVAFDFNLSRISTFSTTNHELQEVLTIDYKAWGKKVKGSFKRPLTVKVIGPEKYLISTLLEKEDGNYVQSYYQMNADGQIVSDEIMETKNLESHTFTPKNGPPLGSIKLPFSTQGQIAVSASGQIHHINTGEFFVNRYDSQGELLQAIYYPFEKASLNEDAFEEEQHPNMQPVYDDVNFPETWPALESLLVDDENNTWVSTIVEDQSVREWYILNESGAVKATFVWPIESEITIVRNGKMYAEEKDSETEAKSIVGYELEYESLSP